MAQARYADAERLIKRALALRERTLGPEHPSVGSSLEDLALLYEKHSRYAEAEPLYERALALYKIALGPEHPSVGASLNSLAGLAMVQRRYAEAEALYKRALALRDKALGTDHPSVGNVLNNLGLLYQNQGRHADAEAMFKRSLAIAERALGPAHPDVASSLNNLALLYEIQDRFGEAEQLFRNSHAIRVRALGPEHPSIARSLNNLAGLAIVNGEWVQAAEYWRESAVVQTRRMTLGLEPASFGQAVTDNRRTEADQSRWQFAGLIKALHRLVLQSKVVATVAAGEMFQTAQWALFSDAAHSLAQMAARGAKGDPGLARIVRERQDLVTEWHWRDGSRTASVSQAPNKRDLARASSNIARLAVIDARIAEIDVRLKAEFPDYAAIASPQPLTVAEVQAQLAPDEALVLFLDTLEWKPMPEETFIWVVTSTEVRWVHSELGTIALAREVAALRCGLDSTSWHASADACFAALKSKPMKDATGRDVLPFDHVRAHTLYKALFGQVEDLIKGKHLLIVPSGSLTQLPLQVLVTHPPSGADHRTIAWLARDNALTVLPAVSSLKALRRSGKPIAATRAMIGFGNPLLDGNQAHSYYGAYFREQAALARAREGCPAKPDRPTAYLRGMSRSPTAIPHEGGMASLTHLRFQAPLPDTADELCAVAQDLGADMHEIRLGSRATEREVKSLSADGQLAQFRIVHFATHGTLAGQITNTTEPGLILTPPTQATVEDDGYLSAGEIAALKLDADWVILSACNTAGGAGGESGAEALSGLARAFFYAQARALLVSHWEVDSAATVKLITSAVGSLAQYPAIGRGEALRRAMLALIDNGEPHQSHPAYWAPFVVVGEGGAGR